MYINLQSLFDQSIVPEYRKLRPKLKFYFLQNQGNGTPHTFFELIILFGKNNGEKKTCFIAKSGSSERAFS